MKRFIIGIGAGLQLAILSALCTAPASAAEDSFAAFHKAAATDETANVQEQVSRGIAAYHRGEYPEAFRLLSGASVIGGPDAHYYLGLMYASGQGTRKSPNLAAYWLKLAARHNRPGAAEALAALKNQPA